MEKFERAQRIVYDRLSKEDWEINKGKFAAVKVESDDFFIADDGGNATVEALKKYPEGGFALIRIGFDSAHVVGSGQLQPITF